MADTAGSILIDFNPMLSSQQVSDFMAGAAWSVLTAFTLTVVLLTGCE